MELITALKGQALRFGTPRSGDGLTIFLPDLVARLREAFRFVEIPEKTADYNLESGISLNLGVWNGALIGNLKIYANGMIVEGAVSTEALDAALDHVESILLTNFNARVVPSEPVARMYTSQLEVRIAADAVNGLAVLEDIRRRLGDKVRAYGVEVGEYVTSGFILGADPLLTKAEAKPGRFLFERRSNRPFVENVFFSDAPLATAEHLAFLTDLEAALVNA